MASMFDWAFERNQLKREEQPKNTTYGSVTDAMFVENEMAGNIFHQTPLSFEHELLNVDYGFVLVKH